MARRALPSSTLSATLRNRLGLSQQELGNFLGVGAAQVGHVEAGRRAYSAQAQARLYRLNDLLPPAPPAPEPPALPAPGPTPGEAAALRKRLRECRHLARQLRYQQAGGPGREAVLAQRRQMLTALREALAAPAPPNEPAADPTREAAWLELLELATARISRRQPTPTAQTWLVLRLRLLDDEAAGLLALLGIGEGQQAPQ